MLQLRDDHYGNPYKYGQNVGDIRGFFGSLTQQFQNNPAATQIGGQIGLAALGVPPGLTSSIGGMGGSGGLSGLLGGLMGGNQQQGPVYQQQPDYMPYILIGGALLAVVLLKK